MGVNIFWNKGRILSHCWKQEECPWRICTGMQGCSEERLFWEFQKSIASCLRKNDLLHESFFKCFCQDFYKYLFYETNVNAYFRQPHKMVRDTQNNSSAKADELFEYVSLFCGVGASRFFILSTLSIVILILRLLLSLQLGLEFISI